MYTSANMGLKIWNLLSDLFDHTIIENNFAILDTHNHANGQGVQIPTGGIQDAAINTTKLSPAAVTDTNIAPLTITGDKIAEDTITADKLSSTITSTLMPLGAVLAYSGPTAPAAFLLCDGSPVSRVTYSALFSLLGTTYGAGDGATTFNLPNLQQRLPLGKASTGTGSTLGASGGAIDHTHTVPSLSVGGLTVPGLPIPPLSIPSLSVNPHFHTLGAGYAEIAVGIVAFGSTTSLWGNLSGHTFQSSTNWNDFSASPWAFQNITPVTATEQAFALGGTTDADPSSTVANSTGAGSFTSPGVTNTGNTGTGTTGIQNPPYLVVNYIIKY